MTSFEEILDSGKPLVYKVKGYSMLPMLHQNRDLVVIEKPKGRLKKYDVAFYKSGENYILHRVIRVKKGCYIIRGDNNSASERVPDEAILGVLTSYVRNGAERSVTDPDYIAYYKRRVRRNPLRRLARFARKVSGNVRRRLKRR